MCSRFRFLCFAPVCMKRSVLIKCCYNLVYDSLEVKFWTQLKNLWQEQRHILTRLFMLLCLFVRTLEQVWSCRSVMNQWTRADGWRAWKSLQLLNLPTNLLQLLWLSVFSQAAGLVCTHSFKHLNLLDELKISKMCVCWKKCWFSAQSGVF